MTAIQNRMRRCKWGWMLYSEGDQWIGRALDKFGEYSEIEVQFLLSLFPAGGWFIDVGANIGAITLPLARKAQFGFAIEPQRITFQHLCANLAVNGIANVHAIQAGAGAGEETIPLMQPAWDGPNNLGGYSLTPGALDQGAEPTRIITIDSLDLSRCDLLKADVEGMEAEVLEGARETIARHRPVLYLEADRDAKTPALIALVHELGYGTWWDIPPLFNPNNYAGNPHNEFGATVSINVLCLPDGRQPPMPMEPALAGEHFRMAQMRVLARDAPGTREVA